ncbi:MAG: DM13 domain-containing protein [Rhizobiaceae bacterium]
MRLLIAFLVGGIFGAAGGVALGFFLFPYVFPPPAATEELQTVQTDKVAEGEFIHANPSDPIHYGGGGVSVYSDTVFLHEDFEVGPGPDYHVYLVPKANIRGSGDLGTAMYVDLGRLKAFEGSQNYAIPAGVDLRDYPSVLIWCQKFSVLISLADLNFEPAS